MSGFKTFLKLGLVGTIVFWLPDIAIHAISGKRFSGVHVGIVTIFLPIVTVLALIKCRRFIFENEYILAAPAFLTGIWVFGGYATMIAATFSGGDYFGADWKQSIVMGLFPPITFITSTYDGSLGAVLITSAFLIVLSLKSLIARSKSKA